MDVHEKVFNYISYRTDIVLNIHLPVAVLLYHVSNIFLTLLTLIFHDCDCDSDCDAHQLLLDSLRQAPDRMRLAVFHGRRNKPVCGKLCRQ